MELLWIRSGMDGGVDVDLEVGEVLVRRSLAKRDPSDLIVGFKGSRQMR